MTTSIYLHIGTFKSGTTYLQNMLWQERGALADAGVLVPGGGPGAQGMAAMDVVEAPREKRRPASEGAWPRLVSELRRWEGPAALVSAERLSHARPEQVRRIQDDLGSARLHVVLTVRDLARTIPTSWQERIKNGQTYTFAEFLAALRDPSLVDEEPAHSFWRQQDVGAILARWCTVVPPDRVRLVTVPPPGAPPRLLLARFAEAVGIDVDWGPDPERTNESIGVAEAELLRRLNAMVQPDLTTVTYDRFVKYGLARDVLSAREQRQRVTLPVAERAWVTRRADELVTALRAGGYPVTGDLGELVPPEPDDREPAPGPGEVSTEEMLDAALDAMDALVRRLAHSHGALRAWLNSGRDNLP